MHLQLPKYFQISIKKIVKFLKICKSHFNKISYFFVPDKKNKTSKFKLKREN